MEEDNEAAIQLEELNNLLAQIEKSMGLIKSLQDANDIAASKSIVLHCLEATQLYLQDQVMDLEPRNDELLS